MIDELLHVIESLEQWAWSDSFYFMIGSFSNSGISGT
jgi:hypothetical protein